MHTHKHTNTNTNVHTHMAGWNGLNSNSIFYTVLFSLPNNQIIQTIYTIGKLKLFKQIITRLLYQTQCFERIF